MKTLITTLFVTLFTFFTTFSYGQNWPKIWLPANVTTDIHGGPIVKGDTVDVAVTMNRNYNDQEPTANKIRSLLFDFENQDDAFTLIQTIVPSGSAMPNANYSISTNYYPHYTWVSSTANSTTNGNTNYYNSNYIYNSASVQKITRITVNVNADLNNGVIFNLRFVVNNTKAGYSYNPLKMNFVAGFTTNSGSGGTIMTNQVCPFILDSAANSLLTLKMEMNSNLATNLMPQVYLLKYDANNTQVDGKTFAIASDGTVNIDQAWLQTNTHYGIVPWAPLDSANVIQRKAVTVSDFTAAQNEFIHQNLDGSYSSSNMTSGMSYYAADVDKNKKFDAADINRLFSLVTGVGYLVDSARNSWNNSVFTITTDSMYNNLKNTNWNGVNLNIVDIYTGTSNKNYNFKYNVIGDINRSHSSQVITTTGTVITTAVPSLKTNSVYVNTPNTISGINVTLNNTTVTSNNIEIPIKIDPNGNSVSALQFEIVYDPNVIKFEELAANVPNTWFTFATPEAGRIRFGSIDKNLDSPLTLAGSPFILKFSSVGNGVDITSQIKVTSNMDASDNKGNQLGINLNTTSIKLTGYNNF